MEEVSQLKARELVQAQLLSMVVAQQVAKELALALDQPLLEEVPYQLEMPQGATQDMQCITQAKDARCKLFSME